MLATIRFSSVTANYSLQNTKSALLGNPVVLSRCETWSFTLCRIQTEDVWRQSTGRGDLCSRKDQLTGAWRICITSTFTICMCITGKIKLFSTHGSNDKYRYSSENLSVWHPVAIYRLKGEGIYFDQKCTSIKKNIIPQYARFKIPHLSFGY
jgi:hypothetical protein